MWAIRQNCISPGRIATAGLIWPLIETISVSSASLTCLIRKKRSGNPRSGGKSYHAVDHQCARQTPEDLFVDEAVRVRMVPEQAWTLPAERRDAHLVLKGFAGVNVDENVVAVALRRHAHAVKVQVRRPVRQIVAECDPHGIADTRPQRRRHIGAVVKQSGDSTVAEPHRTGCSGKRGLKNAVGAAILRWLDQRRGRKRFSLRTRRRASSSKGPATADFPAAAVLPNGLGLMKERRSSVDVEED